MLFAMSHMTNQVQHILTEPQAPGAGNFFELHPVPSLLFARDGVIAAANAAARQLLRDNGAALPGGRLLTVFPELAEQLCDVREPFSQRRVVVRRLDGSNFMACARCTPAVCGALLLVAIEDLSENEAEIAAANREFEALTSAAGHDLRGPLRILKGFAEALDDECGAVLNEEGKTFLAEILKASDRMEGLIDGLLAFSRAARADVNCETLDLTTLIELVYYELRHAHTDREVEYSVEPGMVAWGDVRLIMTVLRSLLGNAWKFTARKSAAKVRCHAERRDGRAWICVTDNGAGFDTSQSERLFRPFTRFHRQDEFPGHGMGLATVQRILRRHGGEISAESTTGEGTTVRFWLPPE